MDQERLGRGGTRARRLAARFLLSGAVITLLGYSVFAQSSSPPVTSIPCGALAQAVIANTGTVFSNSSSLIDSYQSSAGPYGGANVGANGNVEAGTTIVHNGGVIHGTQTQQSPAGLGVASVPANAIKLPRGSQSPGNLNINTAADTITLAPGDYVAANINVNFPGAINVFPAGLVRIFVTGNLNLGGNENLNGKPANLQFLVTSSGNVNVNSNGSLFGVIYAPTSGVNLNSTVFGTVVGNTVTLNSGAAVHFDQSSVCPPPPPATPAVPPAPLPPPPAPVVGCYVNTANGWQSTPCAPDSFVQAHFPHPDVQLDVRAPGATPLLFGQLQTTVPQIQSSTNAFVASTAGIPGCTSSGSPTGAQWSVQNNTNLWTSSIGPKPGDTAATQFVIQSDGTNNGICVWNVDVTAQDYSHRTCVVPSVPQRAGGLQAFDSGNIAAFVNSNNTMTLVAQLSWVQAGQPTQYSVIVPDTYGLSGNWTTISGGILGIGNCSQEQFTNAEVVTQILASPCVNDTDILSPSCATPLQPNATVFTGSIGTVETNNLTAISAPSLGYLNPGLAVANVTGTTSGACLGPSHAFVKDNTLDFGSTPSNLGDQVFWESPDIFLVPRGAPVTLNGVSTETILTPGGDFDVWIRVHNELGCSAVNNVKTLVYLADPSALSVQWDSITNMQFVGDNLSTTGVVVPAGGAQLIGPIPFTAPTTGIGNGHKCILAAIQGDGEAAPTNTTDAPNSNQVAQRNIEFVGPCVYPLTNATTANGNVQLTLTVTPNTGSSPSLTTTPDIEVAFDDADSSWFNVWNAQTGNGSTFTVTHDGGAGTTTVRLGTFSVALNAVPLAAAQTRTARGTLNLPPGGTAATLKIAATLTETGSGGNVTVQNGGSCTANAPIIIP